MDEIRAAFIWIKFIQLETEANLNRCIRNVSSSSSSSLPLLRCTAFVAMADSLALHP